MVQCSEQSGAIIAQHVTSKFIIDKSMMSSFLTFLPFELIIIMQDIPGHFEAAVDKYQRLTPCGNPVTCIENTARM